MSQIVFPESARPFESGADVASGLYVLSQRLAALRPDHQAHGGLGGEFGYGNEYDSDVFSMFPFYWGDCECGYEEPEPNHSSQCWSTTAAANWDKAPGFGASDKAQLRFWKKLGWPKDELLGVLVYCDCGEFDRWQAEIEANPHPSDCPTQRPNFLHKESGFEVRWYKWIGRGLEYSEELSNERWMSILDDCLADLRESE